MIGKQLDFKLVHNIVLLFKLHVMSVTAISVEYYKYKKVKNKYTNKFRTL